MGVTDYEVNSMEEGRVLIIEASWKKTVLFILFSIVFVIGGAVIIQDHAIIGWSAIIFFGLGIPIGVLQLSRKTYLKLDSEGFEMKTISSVCRLKWSDVDRFYVLRDKGSKTVAVDFSDSCQYMKFGRKLASAMSGAEGVIPDQYVLSPEEICAHLNEWKARM